MWCSHSRFWQVFASQLNLAVIVQMRVKYLVSILRDAIMQLPDFSLDVGDTTQKLILECAAAWLDYPAALPTVAERGRLVASPEEKKLPKDVLSLRHQMTGFDAVQPPSTWVVSWMEAFQILVSPFFLYCCLFGQPTTG